MAEYIVTVKEDANWQELHNELVADGISVAKLRETNTRNTHYNLTTEQANNLNKIFEKKNLLIGSIIYLKVSKEIIEQRILNRVICEKCNKIFNELINHEEIQKHECGGKYLKKRHDDDKGLILKRFDTYMSETKPVLDFYVNRTNFFEIDASVEIDKITRKIEEIIKV